MFVEWECDRQHPPEFAAAAKQRKCFIAIASVSTPLKTKLKVFKRHSFSHKKNTKRKCKKIRFLKSTSTLIQQPSTNGFPCHIAYL